MVAMTMLSFAPPPLSLFFSPPSLEQPANKPTDIMPASNKLMARSFLFLINFHLINYFNKGCALAESYCVLPALSRFRHNRQEFLKNSFYIC